MKFARTYSAPGDPYAGVTFEPRTLANRQSRRIGDFRGQGRDGAGELEPGRGRRPRPEVLPQGGRPEGDHARSRKRACRSGCGARSPTDRRWRRSRATISSARSATRAKSSTGWPAAGPIGAGSTATSTRKTTRRSTTTRCARCSRVRSARPTRRSGSTPACTGRTASRARRKGTGTSITADGAGTSLARHVLAPAGQRVLHSRNRRRSRQRRRHLRRRHSRSAHL